MIHRDTRVPEAYKLAGAQYLAVAAAPGGWVACEPLAVDLRAGQRKGKPAREVRDRLDPERTAAFGPTLGSATGSRGAASLPAPGLRGLRRGLDGFGRLRYPRASG